MFFNFIKPTSDVINLSMEETKPEPVSSNVSEDDNSSLDRSFESMANAYDFCVHFINKIDESVDSQYVNAEDNLTLDECMTILQDKLKRAMTNVVYKAKLQEEGISGSTLLSDFVTEPDTDLYVFYEGIKPIVKQVEKQLHYEAITKYSYLDEKKTVKQIKGYLRIYIPLEAIGELPADKIVSRFLDRSVEIRIHDYRGKNWIFAVPKTQCAVLVRNCKVTQKTDKLIVSIGKMSEADNWFSLHKVKCVGEKDTD